MIAGETFTAATNEVPVGAAIIPVPHAVDAGGDMLVGLQISPVPIGKANTLDTLDLVSWPASVRGALQHLTLHVADVGAKGALGTIHTFKRVVICETVWSPVAAASALDLWRANFSARQAQDLIDAMCNDTKAMTARLADNRLAPLVDTAALSRVLHDNYLDRVADEFGMTPPVKAASYETMIDRLKKWTPPGTARDPLGIMIDKIDRDDQHAAWRQAEKQFNLAGGVSASAAEDFTVARARARNRAWLLDRGKAWTSPARVRGIAKASRHAGFHDVLQEFALVRDMNHAAERFLTAQSAQDIARRKLASILSTPSLATFLGMNVEVRIKRDDWRAAAATLTWPGYGAIAITFGEDPPEPQGWTAFVHGGTTGDFFGPCDQAEAIAHRSLSDADIVGGVLNLRRKASDGGDRYLLDITDVVTSIDRQQDFARRKIAALRAGDPGPDVEPNLVGRGLTLIDRDADQAEIARNARLRDLEKTPKSSINFAADLVRGYSVMIGIPTKDMSGHISAPERWRTVMARSLTFESPKQVDRAFIAACVQPEREFGIVTRIPVEQQVEDENGNPQQMILTRQEVFCWHGDSLTVALPSDKHEAKVEIDVTDDFAVSRQYHLPDAPSKGSHDYRPTPLRDGARYLVAMAPSYLGGWGLSVGQAAAVHASDAHGHVLGGSDGQPFCFKRPDKMPAPQVLLPADARLVTGSRKASFHGETLKTLVVRSANGHIIDKTVQRFFFPHGVDFDRAEQQDQFRGVREGKPRGAFRSRTGIVWAEGGGKFPLAVGGDIVTANTVDKSESRGSVLCFAAPDSTGQQYYPDANSQFLKMQLATQTPQDVTAPSLAAPVPFWTDGQAPKDAMPILLELRAVRRDAAKPRIVVASDKIVNVSGGEGPVRVRRVRVSMQPATQITALNAAHPSSTAIVRRHLLGDVLIKSIRTAKAGGRAFAAGKTDEELAIELVETMLRDAIARALTGVEELTLIHAQDRPDPPRFAASDPHRGLTPVVVTVDKDPAPSGGRSWADIVLKRRGDHPSTYDDWQSEEGGLTCYFVGEVAVDPAVTGTLRCEAHWQEWSPAYLTRDKATKSSEHDRVSFAPGPGHGILFTVDAIPSDTAAVTLDLLGTKTKPRALAHSFADGRARRLHATLVATSRFADYFADRGKCESRSAPTELWVPCTFMPPIPTVDRINPVFDYDYRSDGRGNFSFTRTSRLRLELGDDVFKTGEGEEIGVLFRASGTNPCDLFAPALEPFADGFTVQGRDPLHQSPVPEAIGPDRLRSAAMRPVRPGVLKADRSYEGTVIPGGPGVAVNVVPHPVQLDPHAGFYCDVAFDPRDAAERAADLAAQAPYLPFVHLGLARYQEHAIDGLQLSHAVGRDVQLLPWRHGSVAFNGSRTFTVRIEGPMLDEDSRTAPWLEITLVRTYSLGHDKLWIPVAGIAEQVHCAHLKPSAVNGRLLWEWTGTLPHNRFSRHYGLQIDEKERHYVSEEKRYRDRENLFSATIDLGQHRTKLPVEMIGPLL